ncbi:MAG: hypothetical protein ABIJ56_16275 [Pseudomonadota bacterium]
MARYNVSCRCGLGLLMVIMLPGLLPASCGGKQAVSSSSRHGVCENSHPGKMRVGVLVNGIGEILQAQKIGTAADAFGVIVDGDMRYRVFFFPDNVSGSGAYVVTGSQGGIQQHRSFGKVTLATMESMKNLGIHDPYALVRFEINCGDDEEMGHTFVMTDMKRLDGTSEYPLDLTAVIKDILKRSEDLLAEKESEIEELLARQREAGPFQVDERRTIVLPFIYWQDERLVASIRSRVIEDERLLSSPLPDKQAPGPAGANAPKYLSARSMVEFSVTFTVTKDGTIESIEPSEPTHSFTVYPPPM